MSSETLTNFLSNTNMFDISIHGDSNHCLPVKNIHNREIPENIKQEIATFKGIKEIITVDIAKKLIGKPLIVKYPDTSSWSTNYHCIGAKITQVISEASIIDGKEVTVDYIVFTRMHHVEIPENTQAEWANQITTFHYQFDQLKNPNFQNGHVNLFVHPILFNEIMNPESLEAETYHPEAL
jgi:hypothetical protein